MKLDCVNSILREVGALKESGLNGEEKRRVGDLERRLLGYERQLLQQERQNYL